MSQPELPDLTAREVRALIGRKAISPVELMDACIARIEAVDGTVNAIVARRLDGAREDARAAEAAVLRGDELGPLHGLPVTIKDLNDVAGLRTTYGSLAFKDHVPAREDRNVGRLRQAGAIVLGKSNAPEFGAGINTTNKVYGPTRNPFDPARIAGGSSGGAAASLACSMTPIAHGSDTGGSIRIPAAYCGVVGLRPTPGVVPSERRDAGWLALSVEGPMARDVRDTALLMGSMAAHDPDDPLSRPVDRAALANPAPLDLGRLRVAISTDLGFVPVEPEMAAAFREKVARFRHVFREAVDIDPPLADVRATYEVLRTIRSVLAFKSLVAEKGELISEGVKRNVAAGLAYTLEDQAIAHARQTRIHRDILRFFREFDLLLTPTMAFPAHAVDTEFRAQAAGAKLNTYFDGVALTFALTVAALPSLSMPCGLDPIGLPFGLQIAATPHGDAFLLRAAASLEDALASIPGLGRPLPDISALGR